MHRVADIIPPVVPTAKIIVGIGEVLWDMLPDGAQIGGAPANFAYIATLLGNRGVIASRIGSDARGRSLRTHLRRLGVDTSWLQSDRVYPTSTVSVRVDAAGQPRFEIAAPVAWDFLEFTPAWRRLARGADAICFGTLAQRSARSREATRDFLRAARPGSLRIFDANFREPHFSAEVALDSLRQANGLKANESELKQLAQWFGLPAHNQEECARRLRRVFDLKLVCITHGGRGSLLLSESGCHQHPGFRVRVRDTVGSGDAFTAAIAHHFLRGASLARMNRAANRAGAWVAGRSGATPAPESAEIQRIRAGAG